MQVFQARWIASVGQSAGRQAFELGSEHLERLCIYKLLGSTWVPISDLLGQQIKSPLKILTVVRD